MTTQPAEITEKLFTYSDYKAYLRDWIRAHPHRGRGIKSRLARTAGCQVAYLSRVIERDAHLSLEQAMSLQGPLGHGRGEAKYFLLLVELARAGTQSLRAHF